MPPKWFETWQKVSYFYEYFCKQVSKRMPQVVLMPRIIPMWISLRIDNFPGELFWGIRRSQFFMSSIHPYFAITDRNGYLIIFIYHFINRVKFRAIFVFWWKLDFWTVDTDVGLWINVTLRKVEDGDRMKVSPFSRIRSRSWNSQTFQAQTINWHFLLVHSKRSKCWKSVSWKLITNSLPATTSAQFQPPGKCSLNASETFIAQFASPSNFPQTFDNIVSTAVNLGATLSLVEELPQ